MKPTPSNAPYLADYHVHTLFSDDSDCPMDRMLERAVQLGLDEIAFTEHVDHGVKTDLNCDYRPILKSWPWPEGLRGTGSSSNPASSSASRPAPSLNSKRILTPGPSISSS